MSWFTNAVKQRLNGLQTHHLPVGRRFASSEGDPWRLCRRRIGLYLPWGGSERALSIAEETLSEYGFEPYREETGTISLRNCPFHTLARQAPDLVCGLYREFIDGLLRGLGNDSVEAALLPTPGQCCVKLRPPGSRE